MEDPTAGAWPLQSYRNCSHISAAVQLIHHEEAVVIVASLRTLLFVCFVFLIFCLVTTQLLSNNCFYRPVTEVKLKVQYYSETGCCKIKLKK